MAQNLGPGAAPTSGFNLNASFLAIQTGVIVQEPNVAREYYKLNPDYDRPFKHILSTLGMIDTVTDTEFIDSVTVYQRNQFANPLLLAAGAGAGPGLPVTYTVAPASHIVTALGGQADIRPGYGYILQDPATSNPINVWCRPGGIVKTSGANTITLEPLDASVTLPAINNGTPIMRLAPITIEGNTVHTKSGIVTDTFAMGHKTQIMEHQGFEITDLGVFSDNSWRLSDVTIPRVGGGTTTVKNAWSHVGIDLWMKGNEMVESRNMLLGSDNLSRATDGVDTTRGIYPFLKNETGQRFTFTGTITQSDVKAWNNAFRAVGDESATSEYLFFGGYEITNAMRDFMRSAVIAGQCMEITGTNQSIMYDYTSFEYNGYKYHLPNANVTRQFDYGGGLGDFDFTNKAFFIPMGNSGITDSLGKKVPYFRYQMPKKPNSFAPGTHGARTLSFAAGPQFRGLGAFQSSSVMPIEDNVVRISEISYIKDMFALAECYGLIEY